MERRVPRDGQELDAADVLGGKVRAQQLVGQGAEVVDHLDDGPEAKVAHRADAVHQEDQVVHRRRLAVADVEALDATLDDQRLHLTILHHTKGPLVNTRFQITTVVNILQLLHSVVLFFNSQLERSEVHNNNELVNLR